MQQKKLLLVKILFEEVSFKASFDGKDGKAVTQSGAVVCQRSSLTFPRAPTLAGHCLFWTELFCFVRNLAIYG